MRKKHASQVEDAEINLTPMLDIVFIMLIFFIVTASFVKEKGIDVIKPNDDQQEQKQSEPSILIRVLSGERIVLEDRLIDFRQVENNVGRLIAENPARPVVVQAEGEAESGLAIRVMDQAKAAGAFVSLVYEEGAE